MIKRRLAVSTALAIRWRRTLEMMTEVGLVMNREQPLPEGAAHQYAIITIEMGKLTDLLLPPVIPPTETPPELQAPPRIVELEDEDHDTSPTPPTFH